MTWGRNLQERREKREAEKAANLRGLMAPNRTLHTSVYGGTTAAAIPKHEYIRSPALMKAYRLIPCQNCGKDDGTVCGAHANWAEFGKGRGIKASDQFAASLCFTCHGELDAGAVMGKAERYTLWTLAHVKTVRELLARGLWPEAVPVPITEEGIT
jgi:hypothetical protein